MLKAIKLFFKSFKLLLSNISNIQQIFIHFIFILMLCGIHLGLHFIDFLFLQTPQNFFEDALILTSMDSYHYAKGAREFLYLLEKKSQPIEIFNTFFILHPLAILGGVFAKLTNLEFVLTWSSVIFSVSTAVTLYLLVFQMLIFLINPMPIQSSQQDEKEQPLEDFTFLLAQFLAFLASLIGMLLPSFYQRVGVGYFDTDMLLLTLPMLAFVFLFRFLSRIDISFKLLVWFGIFGYLAIIWHNGIQTLLLIGFLLFVCLKAVESIKMRRIPPKILMLTSVFLVILTPSPFGLLALFFLLLGISKKPKNLWIWFVFSFIYAIFFGLFNPLFAQINAYIFGATQHSNTYIYTPVVKTILETMPTSFATLTNRSGGIIFFSFALFGFLLFIFLGFYSQFNLLHINQNLEFNFSNRYFIQCFTKKDSKYPNKTLDDKIYKSFFDMFLFLLPFCLLGFGSLWLGARFSLFLVPIITLGFAFFFFIVLNFQKRFFTPILILSSIAIAVFIANLHYQIPQPILTQAEIRVFKELDSKLKPQDILFSWWDYGYALRYFTKAQVLLDGARHSGAINFPIAKILLSPSPNLFYNFSFDIAQAMQTLPSKQWNQIFEFLSRQYGMREYLQQLESEVQIPKLANEAKIYWILPLRIVPLLASINAFVNVDLESGKILQKETFAFWDSAQNAPNLIPQTTIHLYNNLYTKTIEMQNQTNLTQINFGENSLLLSNYYLKSNIIQIIFFQNYPRKSNIISTNSDIMLILRLN